MKGAVYGTVVGCLIEFVILLYFFRSFSINKDFLSRTIIYPTKKLFLRLLRHGIPTGLTCSAVIILNSELSFLRGEKKPCVLSSKERMGFKCLSQL